MKEDIQEIQQQLDYPLDKISRDIVGAAAYEYMQFRGLLGGTSLNVQVFTSDGTFTVPSGVKYVRVRAVGGGAGGGSSDAESGTTAQTVKSGGGGAYCESVINVDGVDSVSVSIGSGGAGASSSSAGSPVNGSDGGDTTFGSYFTAGGGNGDGTGGTASDADININGGSAEDCRTPARGGTTTQLDSFSGQGGSSVFGPGAFGSFNGNGKNASFPGSGASGGASGAGNGDYAGGDGADGILIVNW